MIKGEHLHKELTGLGDVVGQLEKAGKVYEAAMLKSNLLNTKLLLNIRQNQVAIMQHEGVELIKPKLHNEAQGR